MLRASHGPEWEGAPLPRVLERLAGRLSESLREDERQLLVAVAENIPQREIAEWLGVSYAVARKRLERLRARLTDVAMQYANTLEPDDARELQRFFHRCRARIGARAIARRRGRRDHPRGSPLRHTEDEIMRRSPPTDDHATPQPEPRDERMATLRGQQLLAELAARAEMERSDSPYYADERVVGWLAREVSSPHRSSDGWCAMHAFRSRRRGCAHAPRRRGSRCDSSPARRRWSARASGMIADVLDVAARLRAAPRLDLGAAAGVGRDLWDEPCEQWVRVPDDAPVGSYVSLRVVGESMDPLLHTGDSVLVQVGSRSARDTVVLARVPDAGYVVKRWGR
jgi:hypothetical protein